MDVKPVNQLSDVPAGTGRPGFIADLAFTLIVPWLVLWRLELPAVQTRSIWTGWWPALMVAVLLAVALILGRLQRRPRGFLPYGLRWVLLAAILILPAWLALSIVESGTSKSVMQAGAADVRVELEREMATESSPEAQKKMKQALAATEDAEKLAPALQRLEEKSIATPQAAVDAPLDTPAAAPQPHKETIALAEAIESGKELPPELAEAAEESGVAKEKILGALLVLAAALLAPLLGLSTGVTLMLLQTLVAGGELSVSGALRVGYAMHDAMRPDGSFDEKKVVDDFERFPELAESAGTLAEAARKAGGGNTPGAGALAGAAKRSKASSACLKERISKLSPMDDPEKELRQYCPEASPAAIKRAVKKLGGGAR